MKRKSAPTNKMTITKARELTKLLKQFLQKTAHNIIILSATGVGAGHERQAKFLEEYLTKYVRIRPLFISLRFDQNNRISSFYSFFQQRPNLFDLAAKVLSSFLFTPIIDRYMQSLAQPDNVYSLIKKSRTFHSDLPTLFLTTYGAAEATAVLLLENQLKKKAGGVIAFVPDPLPGNLMRVNTSFRQYKKHLVVLHNKTAQQEYAKVRNPRTPSFALGTLSNPYFLLEKKAKATFSLPIHVGLETGGNPSPIVDKLFMRFINDHRDLLKQKKLFVTAHLMCHKLSVRNFKKLLENYPSVIRKNIRLLFGRNLDEAIITRERYITARDGFPMAGIVFSKGGEVPLEYRGEQIIGAVFGTGHEELDILAGVKENRCVDLRRIHPKEWLKFALAKARENKKNHIVPTQSYAIFAPLLYFDPDCLNRFELG